MFFPCLVNLEMERFPRPTIELLDWWLGTRKKNSVKSLNPLQFSIDTGIDNSISLSMFSHCVYNKGLNLLKIRYVYYCPICDHRMVTASESINESFLVCRNCEMLISKKVLEDLVEILFVLIKEPRSSTPDYTYVDLVGGTFSEKKREASVHRI